jgi:hypothetical protein
VAKNTLEIIIKANTAQAQQALKSLQTTVGAPFQKLPSGTWFASPGRPPLTTMGAPLRAPTYSPCSVIFCQTCATATLMGSLLAPRAA